MRLNTSLLVITAMFCVWFYPQLPDSMATHFNISGAPQDRMKKDNFFLLYGLLMSGMYGVFATLSPGLRRIPVSWINIPNKEYWFAPERKDEALVRIDRNVIKMSAATLLFMLCILLLLFIANLHQPVSMGAEVWVVLLLYMAGLLVLVVLMYKDFRLPA